MTETATESPPTPAPAPTPTPKARMFFPLTPGFTAKFAEWQSLSEAERQLRLLNEIHIGLSNIYTAVATSSRGQGYEIPLLTRLEWRLAEAKRKVKDFVTYPARKIREKAREEILSQMVGPEDDGDYSSTIFERSSI